ncbi:MAG: hypothetical protein IJP00_06165 [Firmicutes bacterium]|nr:hypothetical protein [Bacillota bacterium]
MIEKKMIMIDEERLGFEEKLETLLGGVCKGIFPISIIKDDEGLKGFYYTAGYMPLTVLENISALQVLTILEKTMEAIEECKQYLIFPDEYILSTETVYTSKNLDEVKITYIPGEKTEHSSIKMVNFVKELKRLTTESGVLYLNMLEEMLTLETLSFRGVKNLIIQLKREVTICDVI